MTERGMGFQDWEVRAIRNVTPGSWPSEPIDADLPMKWQTRRLVMPQPTRIVRCGIWEESCGVWRNTGAYPGKRWPCPHGVPGDALWIREKHCIVEGTKDHTGRDPISVFYAATKSNAFFDPHNKTFIEEANFFDDCMVDRWRSSRFMPKWAARSDRLVIRELRVGWVGQIAREDAYAEGMSSFLDVAKLVFRERWDSIDAAPRRRKRNPYTLKPEDCYTSLPFDGERRVEERRGLPHYVVANPLVWALSFERRLNKEE